MHNEILDDFINNSDILYVYENGLQIYGLFEDVNDRDFVLISRDNYIPEGFEPNGKTYTAVTNDGSCHFLLYFVKDWFEEVTNGSIIAWECACLPKKYIHKEHVKLLLQTDLLKLRLNYNKRYNDITSLAKDCILNDYIITGEKLLWYLIKDLMFSNQIIENHKIVNFKEPKESYKQVVNGQLTDCDDIFNIFYKYHRRIWVQFAAQTDGILLKYKTKQVNENL